MNAEEGEESFTGMNEDGHEHDDELEQDNLK